jgi:hypothetical protein
MNLFYLLWLPLVYLFRRSLAPGGQGRTGDAWAFLLGCAAGVVQFFLIPPAGFAAGFGFSRWADIGLTLIGLPAAIPLVVYALFSFLRVFSGDAASFAVLWLIPGTFFRFFSRTPGSFLFVLEPLLWTAIAAGVPFFLNLTRDPRRFRLAAGLGGILILPPLAVTAYWAFYGQNRILGLVLLVLALVPAAGSAGVSLYRTIKNE